MTIFEISKTFILKKLVQIQGNILWCKFKEIGNSARLDNEVLVDKDKGDNNEFDKNKAQNHMIADGMTLTL